MSELEEQGLIKAFEYTYELAWNTLKDFLEYSGQTDIYGSRDAIRKAFELGLIDDGESWMDMLTSRNKTSHTYSEEIAKEICQAVVEVYYSLFTQLKAKLESLRSVSGQAVFNKETKQMKDEKRLYYHPFPQNKKVRMYVSGSEGNIYFRLWNSDDTDLWTDHKWVPYDAIKQAANMYKSKDFDPNSAYDIEIAKELIKEDTDS